MMPTLQQELEKEIRKIAVAAMKRAGNTIHPKLIKLLRSRYESESFVSSLRSGILGADFGLTTEKAQAATLSIIKWIEDHLVMTVKEGKGSLLGSWTITVNGGIVPQDIIGASYSSNGHDIDWLHWLLREGSRVVISDYGVEYGTFQNSRSGRALMKQNNGLFRVQPEYAGTYSDNVVTRFIWKLAGDIAQLMVDEIVAHWR